MKILGFFSLLMILNIFTCSCTPIWSVKLDSIKEVSSKKVVVRDLRSAEQKEFRIVDFLKMTHKSYLGDSNTTPNRIAILESSLNQNLVLNSADSFVEVTQFDILRDSSGSACDGCALAGVSYTAAVIATSGRKPGDDAFTCSLKASLDGKSHFSEVTIPYRVTPLQGIGSEPVKKALQVCIDEAINGWVEEFKK